MKRLALLAVAACTTELPPPWRLDRERIVAVRATPPHLLPGEVGRLDALLAHEHGPTTVEAPAFASAASAPGDLFTAVHFNLDHWEIDGPDETQLAAARAALGLAADAPVPLEVTLELADHLLAKKIVFLGDSATNPSPPPLVLADPVPLGTEIPLEIGNGDAGVRWLTSCGTLRDADSATATLIVSEPCTGELAVILRNAFGGVAWQVVQLHAN